MENGFIRIDYTLVSLYLFNVKSIRRYYTKNKVFFPVSGQSFWYPDQL